MRGARLVLIFAVVAAPSPSPALADSHGPDVSPDGRGRIDTVIRLPGTPGGSNPGGGGGAQPVVGGSPGRGGSGGGPGSGAGSGGGGGPACTYTPAEFIPDNNGNDGKGLYLKECPGQPPEMVYLPGAGNGGAGAAPPAGAPGAPAVPVVTPGMLAQDVLNTLVLPAPEASVNPDATTADGFTLVNLPTWWWIENAGQPLTQRTALGPVWAEVTARPVGSSFDGGEGESAEWCDGPGIAWREGLSEEEPSACRYTYRRAAEHYDATVTLHWQVSWVGSGGAGGTFPEMTTSTTVPMRVYERQAVVVSGRG